MSVFNKSLKYTDIQGFKPVRPNSWKNGQ